MLKIVDRGKGPTFAGFTHKPGWILITCQNQESLGWLESEIPRVKPWTGAELSITPESELPKPTVEIPFVPSSEVESIDEAIHLLRTQNEGLYTELWKVLHSKSEENGHVVTFSLDELGSEGKPTTAVEPDPQPSTSGGQGNAGQSLRRDQGRDPSQPEGPLGLGLRLLASQQDRA
ncbi:Uncharacterized protein OBRU01_23808 [Operophtera brumata]|uniref:DUF4780 domain-containing protein n=1 Tax=Operophtera brumata TaxID=104452 RepID=A0A0L7KNY5_OPEBR|nr:Uncharacterized protein OBRU01_23808 [Operophtera brumata]